MNTVIDQILVKAGAYFGGEGVIYADFDPKKFAELIRADEREACVQDIQMHIPRSGRDTTEYQRAMRMIERIRARGEAK